MDTTLENKSLKKAKIIFWITTTIIFLFEGVLTALTSNTEMARQGIMSLGYPLYFVSMLAIFKVLGTLTLMIPKVPARVKEWAYAGLAIDFICAFISIWVVVGLNIGTFFPIVFLILLIISYVNYHKIKN